jgi:uncharacterized protein
MSDAELINKTAEFVKNKMLGEATGHDWWHVYRVWQTAKHIVASEPEADSTVVELGALLHDIADWKFADGDLEAGPKAAREWLESQKADEVTIAHIEDIIRDTSFKGAKVALTLKTLEAKIIFDADKLDAIGAIGIARAFAYGGAKGRALYEPDEKPVMHESFEDYKNKGETHTINHFYEKLLLLKDLMQTKTGSQMAQQRHKFMEQYLEQFYAEWEGKR